MTKHSTVVGSSSAKRVMNCPGSRPLSAKIPRGGEGSIYAQVGTALHSAIEAYLRGEVAETRDLVGMEFDGITIDDTHVIDKINPALDMLDQLLGEDDDVAYIEAKVDVPIPGAFGIGDYMTRKPGHSGRTLAVIADFKFGDGVIEASEGNHQLMFLASGARHTYPDFFADTSAAVLAIIQPGQEMQPWVCPWEKIDTFERELQHAVTLSDGADAPLAEGDWCRWCPAQVICPLKTQAMAELDTSEANYLEDMSFEVLGARLDKIKGVEQYIEALKTFALSRLEAGCHIPNWKLVATAKRRAWASDKSAERWLSKHLSVKERRVTKLVSPAQAEKLVRKAVADPKLALPARLLDDTPSTGHTLAPEDDPRPSIVSDAEGLKQLDEALGS